MGTLFDEVAARGTHTTVHLDRPLDIAPDRGAAYTVAQLADLVREAAGWLSAAGVRAGDRVAVVKRNHWDYDVLACAAIRLGALPALISSHLDADTVDTLLARLDPALLVTDRVPGSTRGRRVLSLGESFPGALTLDDVRGSPAPAPRGRHDDKPLIINHTSGTTGVPKLVVHSTRTIIHRLARFEAIRWPLIGTRRDDVVGQASSYAHGRTFCWTASVFCLAPKEIVLLSEHTSAARVFGAHPPTTLEALPSAYVRWQPLAASPENPFQSVRLFVSTYDAMHPPAIRTMLNASSRRSPLWMQGWGQTETGPLTFRFLTRRALARANPTTRHLGRPLPGKTRLRVVDPQTFEPLARGRTGLVLARTGAQCVGYVGERERWHAKNFGLWWNTGDLGTVTRAGGVLLLDRAVDSVPGLSCLEVEDRVEDRLPGVVECVLLGASDRLPIPVVVTVDGWLDLDEWRTAVADLPPMADPHVLTWSEVPRTGTGKVRRAELLTRLVGRADTPGSAQWT
jgi:acyl-coenzyme A synthetase/AMP-(fatty) acid ligase